MILLLGQRLESSGMMQVTELELLGLEELYQLN